MKTALYCVAVAVVSIAVTLLVDREHPLSHHQDREAGERYAAQLGSPDMPPSRIRNFINIQCQVAAEALYDNPMFDDSRGDWTAPGQWEFYDGCIDKRGGHGAEPVPDAMAPYIRGLVTCRENSGMCDPRYVDLLN